MIMTIRGDRWKISLAGVFVCTGDVDSLTRVILRLISKANPGMTFASWL
jgi:hypothetical protein